MRALVYRGPRTLVLEEVDRPAVRPDEVLLRVDATGICGSDVHGYLGITGRRIPPVIMGHEFCGTVAEVGSEVEGVRPGDRGAVAPVMSCGACEACRDGRVYLCASRRLFGVMACNGSMAEYLNVPARLLFRMPDAMPPELGAMVEPSAVALHALSRAAVGIDDAAVLVVGAGPIGLLLTGLARRRRPRRLLVSDLSDERLAGSRRSPARARSSACRCRRRRSWRRSCSVGEGSSRRSAGEPWSSTSAPACRPPRAASPPAWPSAGWSSPTRR